MLDDYSGTYTSDQALAVGTLMYHAGVAVNMDYGQSSSGAYDSDVCPALINNFGYNSSAKLESRESYSDSEWETLIYTELQNGRPLYYSGLSADNSGHAFICDGYDATNDNYHFNWGWGGYCDGYYPLTGTGALQPNGSGIGGAGTEAAYTISQSAIIGLQPATTIEANRVVLDRNNLPIMVGSSIKLNPTVYPFGVANAELTWSSSNTDVASVNANGIVTVNSAGTATITCTTTNGLVKDECLVLASTKSSILNSYNSYLTLESTGYTTDATYKMLNFDVINNGSKIIDVSVIKVKYPGTYSVVTNYGGIEELPAYGGYNVSISVESETNYVYEMDYICDGIPYIYCTDSSDPAYIDYANPYSGNIVTPGDLNNDNKIGVEDAQSLAGMILGKSITDKSAADVNGDGKVTLIDLIMLIKQMLGK